MVLQVPAPLQLMLLFRILCLLLLLPVLANATDSSSSGYYKRYQYYPKYCSTPQQMMKERSIPPLRQQQDVQIQIQHVTAIIRHGARTPWSSTIHCWDDYWSSDVTGIWDCNDLTSYNYLPSSSQAQEEQDEDEQDEDKDMMFLFEKRYDAFTSSSTHSDSNEVYSNFLNGTCQMGQLISQGYQQEIQNGLFLRDAYLQVYNNNDNNNNNQSKSSQQLDKFPTSMKLMNLSSDDLNEQLPIYYRSDDDQRTTMSGQIVLKGMLSGVQKEQQGDAAPIIRIPMHTSDRDRDIIGPNPSSCPRLGEIQFPKSPEAASPQFLALNTSKEAQILRQFQRDVLKVRGAATTRDMDAIDCFMTTICTDRPLPSINVLEDEFPYHANGNDNNNSNQPKPSSSSGKYGTNLIQRLMDFETELYHSIPMKANDSEYSKLSMGPLWYEILAQIQPHLQVQQQQHKVLPKLSLFAGHDTTLMPLLASIQSDLLPPKHWPPYASMLIIETYSVVAAQQQTTTKPLKYPSGFAFRLIYNGNVLTSQIHGCNDNNNNDNSSNNHSSSSTNDDANELCDMQILLDRIKPFANRKPDCRLHYEDDEGHNTNGNGGQLHPILQTKDILSTPEGTMYLILIITTSLFAGILLGCIIGSCCSGDRGGGGGGGRLDGFLLRYCCCRRRRRAGHQLIQLTTTTTTPPTAVAAGEEEHNDIGQKSAVAAYRDDADDDDDPML